MFDLYHRHREHHVLLRAAAGAYLLRSALRRDGARHARTESDGGSVFLEQAHDGDGRTGSSIRSSTSSRRCASRPTWSRCSRCVPAAGAGVALGFGWFGLASLLAVMATFCDILDGLLARKTGVSSDAGEVLDAAVDRYGEMFFFGGLVYYYRVARPGAVHRAGGDHRLVHGQLRDRQGRGDGRRRPARRDAPRRAGGVPDLRRGVHAAVEGAVRELAVAGAQRAADHPDAHASSRWCRTSRSSSGSARSTMLLRAKEKAPPVAPAPTSPTPLGSKPDASAGQV